MANVSQETGRANLTKQAEKESFQHIERVPSGRSQFNLAATVSADDQKRRTGHIDIKESDFDYSEETRGHEKPLWMVNKKGDSFQTLTLEDKMRKNGHKDLPHFGTDNLKSEDDLNTLLKVFEM